MLSGWTSSPEWHSSVSAKATRCTQVEHTLLVTLVGRDILRGRILTERLEPDDYVHVIVGCLLHDIGYVRGI